MISTPSGCGAEARESAGFASRTSRHLVESLSLVPRETLEVRRAPDDLRVAQLVDVRLATRAETSIS
jgi:hypothetical protein